MPENSRKEATGSLLSKSQGKKRVEVITSFEVCKVIKRKNEFEMISFDGRKAYADKVIIATGGKAAPYLGTKGVGYEILNSFGHRVTKLRPSLVQMKIQTTFEADKV